MWALLTFVTAYEASYSLVPPLEHTGVNEAGNWTLRGGAINLKTKIRLTQNLPFTHGELCQRVPLLHSSWSIEAEVSARDGNGGHSLWFLFTEEFCPVFTEPMHGIAVMIDAKEGLTNHLKVFELDGPLLDPDQLPTALEVPFHDSQKNLRIGFRYENKQFTVSYGREKYTHELQKESGLWYPSIQGLTSQDTDNIEVHSVQAYFSGPQTRGKPGFDYSTQNRMLLEKMKNSRRQKKLMRRKEMQTVMRYFNESEKNHKVLTGSRESLEEALKILGEATTRTQQAVRVEGLEQFIHTRIMRTIEMTMMEIDRSQNEMREIKEELEILWSYLQTSLVDLAVGTKNGMESLKAELSERAKSVKLDSVDPSKLKGRVDTIESSPVAFILLVVAAVEFAVYAVFFVYMRKSTKNFTRKND